MPNDHSQRLPLIPDHHDEETYRGYLSRLSQANGLGPVFWPLIGSLKATSQTLEQVAGWTGIERERLAARGSLVDHGGVHRVRLGASLLDRSHIHLCTRQICPSCMAEERPVPCSWDLRGYTVCTRHGDALLRRCDECGETLKWSTTPGVACVCGKPFGAMSSRFSGQMLARHSSHLEQAVRVSLGLIPRDARRPSLEDLLAIRDVYNHITNRSASELVALRARLAASSMGGSSGWRSAAVTGKSFGHPPARPGASRLPRRMAYLGLPQRREVAKAPVATAQE